MSEERATAGRAGRTVTEYEIVQSALLAHYIDHFGLSDARPGRGEYTITCKCGRRFGPDPSEAAVLNSWAYHASTNIVHGRIVAAERRGLA